MRNKLAKNSIAVGLVTLIITAGLSFSAQSAPGDNDVAFAEARASQGTGLFESLDLDSGVCAATLPAGTTVGSPAATPVGTPDGRCGDGLNTVGIDAFDQTATASLSGADGMSTARAAVGEIEFGELGDPIDITNLIADLGNTNTATILDTLIEPLDGVLDALLIAALGAITTPLDDALQSVLDGLDDTLISVQLSVGAVTAQCAADPTTATASNVTVAPVNLTLTVGDFETNVPIEVITTPNSNLVVDSDEAAQQIAADIVDGIVASTTAIPGLSTLLDAADLLLAGVKDTIVNELIDALEGPLLTPLGNAIEPILTGTVNVQAPVSPADDQIDVTGLSLTLLGSNTLNLARVHCGPNSTAAAADDDDTQADDTQADDTQADDTQADDTDADSTDADAAADADSQADADVTTTLPATGSPNLLPFWMLGLGLLLFGATVLLNEKRRLQV